MAFTLEVRRARKGDCLLLHCGSKNKPGLIIIDGGPQNVYGPQLRDRLERLAARRKRPLPVDVVLVSHVDDDHIRGLLDLTREELERAQAGEQRLLAVKTLWHNTFPKLVGDGAPTLVSALRSQFGAAAMHGTDDLSGDKLDEIAASFEEDHPDASDEELADGLKVLASLDQGDRLKTDAEGLDWSVNAEFGGELICFDPARGSFNLANGLKVTVIGPLSEEIEALRQEHAKWVKEQEENGRTPAQAIAAYVDKSITNLSSIVLLLEQGGKSILLTGDARGDKIIKGLEEAQLLKAGGKLHIDVLKVPHHGSSNNLEQTFFERVVAKHYVFSGDGEHGNPERDAVKMLFDARGSDPLTVHFTYPLNEIDKNRKLEWSKQLKRKLKKPEKRGLPKPADLEVWSEEKHGLVAFFDQQSLPPGQSYAIVYEDKDHKIDLLDPLKD